MMKAQAGGLLALIARRPFVSLTVALAIILLGHVGYSSYDLTRSYVDLHSFVRDQVDIPPPFSSNCTLPISFPISRLTKCRTPDDLQAQLAALNLGYSAVILYLANLRRLLELQTSLRSLFRNLPPQTSHPWPILLLYTEDLDDADLRSDFGLRLYDYLGGGQDAWWFVSRIEWVRLEWALPATISHDKEVVDPVFDDVWPGPSLTPSAFFPFFNYFRINITGYHLMCAFFATQIFAHPRLRDVTYYMRLDTDSYLLSPPCEDPFARMHSRNASYGFRATGSDPPWVIHGMWAFLSQYARAHPAVEAKLAENGWQWPSGREEAEGMSNAGFPGYQNNFEVVNLDAFRKPEVRAWMEEIVSDPERIFKYRWGASSFFTSFSPAFVERVLLLIFCAATLQETRH